MFYHGNFGENMLHTWAMGSDNDDDDDDWLAILLTYDCPITGNKRLAGSDLPVSSTKQPRCLHCIPKQNCLKLSVLNVLKASPMFWKFCLFYSLGMCNQGWMRPVWMWFQWPPQILHQHRLPSALVVQPVKMSNVIVTRTLIHIFSDLMIALPAATPILLLITWNGKPLRKKGPRCLALIGRFLF